MNLYSVTNIIWDCDDDAKSDEQRQELAEALQLPSSAYVHAEDEDEIADVLSDRYGYCIRSLDTDEVTNSMVVHAD